MREKAAKLRARDSTAATQPNEANATVREYEADADAVPGVVAPPAREAESASTGGGLLRFSDLNRYANTIHIPFRRTRSVFDPLPGPIEYSARVLLGQPVHDVQKLARGELRRE